MHRHFKTNLKLNQKIPILFITRKNYDLHLFMQELGKFNSEMSYTKLIRKIHEL